MAQVPSARAPSRLYGTPHPIALTAADDRERWVVACQARRDTDGDGEISIHEVQHGGFSGDELQPYFIVGGGEGEAIDDFVDASRDGNWVVYVRGGALTLFDVARASASELRVAPLGDVSPPDPDTAASFSDDSSRLLYVHRSGRNVRLVIRTLSDGTEREIDPGPGLFWRASIVANAWVQVEAVTRDSNGDGMFELPSPIRRPSARRCQGALGSYGDYGWRGDAPTTRWFPIGGGAEVALGEVLTGWGVGVVVRRDRAIEFVSRDGSRREMVPAACDGALLGSDEASSRLLVACRSGDAGCRRPEVVALDGRFPLDFEVPAGREYRSSDGRFAIVEVCGVARTTTSIVDLRLGRLLTIPGVALMVAGGAVLLARDGALFARDLATGDETRLALTRRPDEWVREYQNYARLGGAIVDVPGRRIVGAADERIERISSTGRALLAAERSYNVTSGPLRWETLSSLEGTRQGTEAGTTTP